MHSISLSQMALIINLNFQHDRSELKSLIKPADPLAPSRQN